MSSVGAVQLRNETEKDPRRNGTSQRTKGRILLAAHNACRPRSGFASRPGRDPTPAPAPPVSWTEQSSRSVVQLPVSLGTGERAPESNSDGPKQTHESSQTRGFCLAYLSVSRRDASMGMLMATPVRSRAAMKEGFCYAAKIRRAQIRCRNHRWSFIQILRRSQHTVHTVNNTRKLKGINSGIKDAVGAGSKFRS